MKYQILREQTRHGTWQFPLAWYRMEGAEGFNVPLHWHEEVEILCLKQGDFRFSYNMQEETVQPPALLFFSPGAIHSLAASGNPSASSLVFRLEMLEFSQNDEVQSGLLHPLSAGSLCFPRQIPSCHPCFSSALSVYQRAFDCAVAGSLASRTALKAHLLELISILAEHSLLSSASLESGIRPETLSNARLLLQYLNQHYAERITAQDMARLVGLNEQYFCRYFRRLFGQTFTSFLNEIRLEQAAASLLQTDRRVLDIALESGFENVGYFIRRFRSYTGMTPQAYRKSQNSIINQSK